VRAESPQPANAESTRADLLLTVGHSSHSLDHFLGLLTTQAVELLADVRSHPYSRFAPHFNREPLVQALAERRIAYDFLGRELGGRPEGAEYYDDEGHVLYGRVADSPSFAAGLERLEQRRGRSRVAIMCSEEDPTHCHRRLLVARVLLERGVDLLHLRGDGRLQRDGELGGAAQGNLFNGFEEAAWRSTRSVSPRRAPLSSSVS
jgi:uncharacterized protein (DUF488 family)